MVLTQVEVDRLARFSSWGREHDIGEDSRVVLSKEIDPWASYAPELRVSVPDDSATRGDASVKSPHGELEDSPASVASGRACLRAFAICKP